MRQVTFGRVRELMGYGIPIEAIAAVVPAPGRIALDRTDKLYWPDDDGRAAWIFPVRCVDPADPEAIEYLDFDQGGAAASSGRLAFPSIIRRAQQCRHRSE